MAGSEHEEAGHGPDAVEKVPGEGIGREQEGRGKAIHILVNTRKRTVHDDDIAYEEVVELAFPSPRVENPDTYYSVTYTGAAAQPSSGELGPTGTLKIKDGTAFRVTKTIKS